MLKTPILRWALLALASSVSLVAHATRGDVTRAGLLASDVTALRSPEDSGNSPPQDGDDTTGNRGVFQATQSRIQEVTVTARRREENVQEVPIAITVISQQTLQDNNVQTIGDLQYIVPSMSASAYQSRDALNVSIRGQGVNASSGLPGVIAYLNEVPLPTDNEGNINGAPGTFFDLENLQVLKGPQGTLFGRNSVGGALLLQTARPKSELDATLQLGYGNYNNREVDGAINIPLVKDVLLARVAVNGQWRDGFTQLLGEPSRPGGVDVDNRNSRSIRGTVSFQPGSAFKNDTIVTYSKSTNRGTPNFLTALNPTALIPTLFPAIVGLFEQQRALGSSTHILLDTDLLSTFSNLAMDNISSLELSGSLRFRNIFGYDEQRLVGTADSDATALPIYQYPQRDTERLRQFTDEAQLLGKSFGGTLDWIVGGFYLHQPHTNFVHETAVIFGGVAEDGRQRGDLSKAVYAQGTYDLSSLLAHLGFTAGARYTWDERFQSTYVGPRSNEALAASAETKNRALTWTLGLNDQVTPETLLYLTSRRGYRPGGPNNSLGSLLPDFNPEYLTDGELGLKSDWTLAGVPIRTNVALYYQKYTDVQVSQLYIGGSGIGAFITRNAAAARQYGAEFESVMQLPRNLQLGASFDYLNFKYTEFGPGVDTVQLGSNSQAGRPRIKYGVNVRYQRHLGPDVGDISVEANWNWQASSGSLDQSAGSLIPSFGLLNMAAAWNDIGGTYLSASLFASNVLDKVYSIGGFGTYTLYGISTNKYGEPRMYGMRLRYRF